jgi:hypothetical protein
LSGLPEGIAYLAVVAVLVVIAIRLGMLLAPRLDRMTQPDDEEDGGHPD